MDFYSLISCVSISTNRFTDKCDCFQNQYDNFFLYLEHMQNVNRRPNHEHIFMKQNVICNFFSSAFGVET